MDFCVGSQQKSTDTNILLRCKLNQNTVQNGNCCLWVASECCNSQKQIHAITDLLALDSSFIREVL